MKNKININKLLQILTLAVAAGHLEVSRNQYLVMKLQQQHTVESSNLQDGQIQLAKDQAILAKAKAELLSDQLKLAEEKAKWDKTDLEKSNMFDFIGDAFNNFTDYVYSLDLLHSLALVNFLVLIFIIDILFAIFVVWFSDFLIGTLELESKFPSLARFLKIRKSMVKGNIIVYSCLLFVVFAYGLYANLSILLV